MAFWAESHYYATFILLHQSADSCAPEGLNISAGTCQSQSGASLLMPEAAPDIYAQPQV